ncbi:MAG: hypothetical protein LC797_13090 [Chloroflexi bacterium]|nr:hypothetical protein [Chloroflexota bacterium]
MIQVDANLLVYAHVLRFLSTTLPATGSMRSSTGTAGWAVPRPSLLAFLRLVINPRVFERAEPMVEAWTQVQAWLGVIRRGFRSLGTDTSAGR